MSKLFRKVGLGGTFDVIHTGHVRLLTEALRVGQHVVVAVTSDEFACKTKPYPVRSFQERVANLRRVLKMLARGETYEIQRLDDRYGTAVSDPELEAIVVSVETLKPALEINDIRFESELPPLHILVIPMIRDGYGAKYSSRWLRDYLSR